MRICSGVSFMNSSRVSSSRRRTARPGCSWRLMSPRRPICRGNIIEVKFDSSLKQKCRQYPAIHTNYSCQALTLDCGNQWPVNPKIHWPPKKHTGPPKTCNDPNFFAAGIYDFTREVAYFCTLGLYITKNKYELTLPFEFCRFPVKIMAAYEALSTNKK